MTKAKLIQKTVSTEGPHHFRIIPNARGLLKTGKAEALDGKEMGSATETTC